MPYIFNEKISNYNQSNLQFIFQIEFCMIKLLLQSILKKCKLENVNKNKKFRETKLLPAIVSKFIAYNTIIIQIKSSIYVKN